MKALFKKILKIAAATAGVLLLLFVMFTFYIIKESSSPSDVTENTTSVSSEQSADETTEYIDAAISDELKLYGNSKEIFSISLNENSCKSFVNDLNSENEIFSMSEYYGLEEVMELYRNTSVNKSSSSVLLDNDGMLDADKLAKKVIENNALLMNEGTNSINVFYTELTSEEISSICKLIAHVINDEPYDISVSDAANTLEQLTMFQRTSSASNAYVTNNLTFVFNPTMTEMYGNISEITGTLENSEDANDAVLVHEIMHLLQYSASDKDSSNGIEAGICRMYNVPGEDPIVSSDSLWNSWILEGSAELGMASYLNYKAGIYAKKISYIKSYNLSRFNDLNLESDGLEHVTFAHSLEDAFSRLKLDSQSEQDEFLKFLYSVEITQTDPEDFWEIYTEKTGETPSDEEHSGIRMDIRTDAIEYLTRNFYRNLAEAVVQGKISDSDTLFYLMRTWELDVYNHLQYAEVTSLNHCDDFILWHDNIQKEFFQALTESNDFSANELWTSYENYCLRSQDDETISDNCSLDTYNKYMSSYITDLKNGYNSSKFSKNSVMAEYIKKTP